jgi:hypothetical protein
MSNLLFLRRSYQYRHAAVAAFRTARAMPIGSERNNTRVLARGFRDLARAEAWLEGDRSNVRRIPLERPRPPRDLATAGP